MQGCQAAYFDRDEIERTICIVYLRVGREMKPEWASETGWGEQVYVCDYILRTRSYHGASKDDEKQTIIRREMGVKRETSKVPGMPYLELRLKLYPESGSPKE